MEDGCVRGEIRTYDLWFSYGEDREGEYIGTLFQLDFRTPVLLFASEDSHTKFKALIPDDRYVYLMERGKETESQQISLAEFLTRCQCRQERIGLPKIIRHRNLEELFNSL